MIIVWVVWILSITWAHMIVHVTMWLPKNRWYPDGHVYPSKTTMQHHPYEIPQEGNWEKEQEEDTTLDFAFHFPLKSFAGGPSYGNYQPAV